MRTLYRNIADRLRERIASGALPPGARLPSSRALARQLGVSRNTVLAAYGVLVTEGTIASRAGSGTRVVCPPRRATLDPHRLLRSAHYPVDPMRFVDPDGNMVTLHR